MEVHIYFPFQSFRAFEVRSEFHLTVGQRGCEGEREMGIWQVVTDQDPREGERARKGEEGKKGGGMTRLRDRWRLSSRRLSPGRQTADLRSEPQRERDGNKRTRGNMKKCQVGRRWFLFLTLWRELHSFITDSYICMLVSAKCNDKSSQEQFVGAVDRTNTKCGYVPSVWSHGTAYD